MKPFAALAEGAALVQNQRVRPGTGNVVEAVRHMRCINTQIRQLQGLPDEELMTVAKELRAPYDLVKQTRELGRLPVVNFAAGGIATPADAALMMRLGCDGVFVGSGIFKSSDPKLCARAIVDAVAHFEEATKLAEFSKNLGQPMKGLEISAIPQAELLQARGW